MKNNKTKEINDTKKIDKFIYINDYEVFILKKRNESYKFIVGKINNQLVLKCRNYETKLTFKQLLKKTEINLNEFEDIYKLIINLFTEKNVIIQDIINSVEIVLILILKYNNIEKKINIFLPFNSVCKYKAYQLCFDNSFHIYFTLLKEIRIYSDVFCIFNSINNDIMYLIYKDNKNSIISYNMNECKKIKEIKNAHKHEITNFKYCIDKINKRDLIISRSNELIKLWNAYNWENLWNINSFDIDAFFLKDKDQIKLIYSDKKDNDIIKIIDINSKKLNEKNLKEINEFYRKRIADCFYNKKKSKSYILYIIDRFLISYDYNENKIYHKYSQDDENFYHEDLIINDNQDIIKLICSNKDQIIRIWNFDKGILLKKIETREKFFNICLWDNSYIIVNFDKKLKFLDLNNKEMKELYFDKNILDYDISKIEKIILPKYGDCLIISMKYIIHSIILVLRK